MPGTRWFWPAKSQGIKGASYLCSYQDGKDLIIHARRWQQETQDMAGPHLCFPTLVLSSTSQWFGQTQCLGEHCPQQLVFLEGTLGTWGLRSAWEWQGQKAAITLHLSSRLWRPWRDSSSLSFVHGALRMKRIYTVSRNSCSYRKVWILVVFFFFCLLWFFSLNALL